MFNFKKCFFAILLFSFSAQAETGLSINLGIGLPFITQGGVHYYITDQFSVAVEYNVLDLDADTASVELTMPAVMAYFHPFSGAYFIGGGIGKESLDVIATDSTTNESARAEVDANTTIIKTGWMWGRENGGFWFGIDASYIIPSSADSRVTTTNDSLVIGTDEYQDVVDAADDFGDTSYVNITFARFGWSF